MRQWIAGVVLCFIAVLSLQGLYKTKRELSAIQQQYVLQQERYGALQGAVLQYAEEASNASKNLSNSLQELPAEDREILSRPLPSTVRDSLCSYATCKPVRTLP